MGGQTGTAGFFITKGCDAMQGYWFSKPLPAENFSDLLKQDMRLTTGY